MEPLQAEFGWSRSQISAGLAIAAMSTVPLSPLVGAAIDKWGSRRIALPGLLLTACTLASFGTTSSSVAHWIGLWCVYALIGLTVKSTVWTYAISSTFSAGRGLALAVMLSGTAIAQSLVPPVSRWLIANFGWREAWFWLGFGWCVPAFILAWFFLKDQPRVRERPTSEAAPLGDSDERMTIRQALTNPALLQLALATFIMMTLGLGVIVHQVPILTELGLTRERAAWLASISGIAGIAGKLITGALMDRFDGAKIGAATIATSALGFGILLVSSNLIAIISGVAIIGYAVGTKLQITAYLTSKLTGMASFGKIFGLMNSVIALCAGLGPLLSGMIFDAFGSYQYLLIAGVPGSLLSGILILRCRSSRTEAQPAAIQVR
ncbi:MFS transporter [Novosphingobium sp. M1R2S20]|uniref:MFS transporter n=1 Tax=Novosphingobium rhizovicinum TaxID=3228928 RepID=A0ABV3RES9_9SPHN